MRTIITTEYGESRVIFGEFWGYPGSDCHYAFWADTVGGAQKTRTYVARAVWPPQTWARPTSARLGPGASHRDGEVRERQDVSSCRAWHSAHPGHSPDV